MACGKIWAESAASERKLRWNFGKYVERLIIQFGWRCSGLLRSRQDGHLTLFRLEIL